MSVCICAHSSKTLTVSHCTLALTGCCMVIIELHQHDYSIILAILFTNIILLFYSEFVASRLVDAHHFRYIWHSVSILENCMWVCRLCSMLPINLSLHCNTNTLQQKSNMSLFMCEYLNAWQCCLSAFLYIGIFAILITISLSLNTKV